MGRRKNSLRLLQMECVGIKRSSFSSRASVLHKSAILFNDPVQEILPKVAWRTKQPNIPIGDCDTGAVIFGQSEKYRLWFPRDAHRDPEEDKYGAKTENEARGDAERSSANPQLLAPIAESSSKGSRSNNTSSNFLIGSNPESSDLITPATSVEPSENVSSSMSRQGNRPSDAAVLSQAREREVGVQAKSSPPAAIGTWHRFARRFNKKDGRK